MNGIKQIIPMHFWGKWTWMETVLYWEDSWALIWWTGTCMGFGTGLLVRFSLALHLCQSTVNESKCCVYLRLFASNILSSITKNFDYQKVCDAPLFFFMVIVAFQQTIHVYPLQCHHTVTLLSWLLLFSLFFFIWQRNSCLFFLFIQCWSYLKMVCPIFHHIDVVLIIIVVLLLHNFCLQSLSDYNPGARCIEFGMIVQGI